MIEPGALSIEPWAVAEPRLRLDLLAQTESLFALSNGHIGLRATLDEGEPHGLPGTYLNGFYEIRPLPYPEGGFGYPESGQSVINVTDGKIIRLIEGPLAPLPCASETAFRKCDECADIATCGTRIVMREVRDAIAAVLDSTTLAMVCRKVDDALERSAEPESIMYYI